MRKNNVEAQNETMVWLLLFRGLAGKKRINFFKKEGVGGTKQNKNRHSVLKCFVTYMQNLQECSPKLPYFSVFSGNTSRPV